MAVAAFAGGAAGAVALTLVHEAARRTVPDAPRMDVLGERATAGGLRAAGAEPPEPRLHDLALAGDLVSNTAYYALVSIGPPDGAVVRGGLLGLAAGLGAMTVAWYTLGGLVAGAVYRGLGGRNG